MALRVLVVPDGGNVRTFVLSVAKQPQVRALLTSGPGKALAGRFVAGETLDDALRTTRRLLAAGAQVSLDFLGEDVASFSEAESAAQVYHDTLLALRRASLNASLSIKPTQFGIDLDFDRCRALVAKLATDAATLPATVRLDMESSAHTDGTLRLWRDLKEQHPNVGIVLQAALRRTAQDLDQALALGATIRLCKGAYAEPARIAFAEKRGVDSNYQHLMMRLLDAAAKMPPIGAGNEPRAAIATHDDRLITIARGVARRLKMGGDRFEFQMLLGVRRELQYRLIGAGEPLRVYVPWGPAWYPYFSRRLAERPANLLFAGRAIFSELVPRLKDGRRL